MRRRRVLFGMVLVVVGVVLVLDRIGGTREAIPMLRRWWPLAIILVGLWNLVRFIPRPWSFWGPIIVMVGGAITLLATLGRIPDGALRFAWPVVLIALGLAISLIEIEQPERGGKWVKEMAVLRGKRFAIAKDLPGYAKATAIFGHLVIDLTSSAIDEKAPRATELNITALCGHVEVLVPDTWRIIPHPAVGIRARVSAPSRDGTSGNGQRPPLDVHVLGVFGRAELKQS
jgi:hypothetical protein